MIIREKLFGSKTEFFFFILEFDEERYLVILMRVTSIDEEPFVSFFSRSSYFRHGFLE
jgi:hypothetical protein